MGVEYRPDLGPKGALTLGIAPTPQGGQQVLFAGSSADWWPDTTQIMSHRTIYPAVCTHGHSPCARWHLLLLALLHKCACAPGHQSSVLGTSRIKSAHHTTPTLTTAADVAGINRCVHGAHARVRAVFRRQGWCVHAAASLNFPFMPLYILVNAAAGLCQDV